MGAEAGDPGGRVNDSRVPPGNRVRRALRRLGTRRLLVGGLLAAVAVRWPLLSHESLDFATNLTDWYRFIAANGGFAALRYDFAEYAPAYLTLLAGAVSFLSELPAVLAVKAVSLPFDFLLAFFVHRCVGLKYPDAKEIPALAALAVLFTPTVLLNGALWGQADAIYTAFLLGGLSFLLAGRRRAAFALFGVAFGFKAQAVFLAPLLLCLFRKRAAAVRGFGWDFGWSALAYFGTLLPAWFLGRPLGEMLSTYLRQGQVYRHLTMDAANLWQWIPNDLYPFWPLGVLGALALVWGLAVLVGKSRAALTPDRIVFLAAFSVLVVPFFLPKMLDRYFFPAEVFAVVLAFWRPRLWFVPVGLGLTGLNVYLPNGAGFASPLLPYSWTAGVHLGLVVALAGLLLRDLGYSLRYRDLAASLRRAVRARGAAAAPLLLLLGAFAGVLSFGGAAGRFERPFGGDPAETRTLAAAANLSADPSPLPFPARFLSGFTGRSPTADGEAAYHFAGPPPPPAGHWLLGAVTFHLGAGSENALLARLAAARVLMALLFAGAALLAGLALGRLLGNRWLAAGATLLAFSAGLGAGGYDRVTLEGAPAVFGLFLAFHGLVVFAAGGFRREGRRPALLRCGAGMLFGFGAGALLLVFAAVGLLSGWLRRGAAVPPVGWGPPAEGSRPVGAGPGDDAGPGEGAGRGPPGNGAFALLGAFALVVGGAVFGSGAASRAALPAGGGGGETGATAGTSTLPVSDRSAGGVAPGPSRSFRERSSGSAARWLVPGGFLPGADPDPAFAAGLALAEARRPHAAAARRERFLPGAPGGADPVRNAAGRVGLVAALLTLGGLVGALCSRRRLLLLPLAVGGWGGALLGEAFGGAPGSFAALSLGPAVVLGALLALALCRLPGLARSRVFPGLFVVLASAVFLGSGYRAARAGSATDSATDSVGGTVDLRGPVGEDLQRVRRVLERRVWHRPDRAGRFSTRRPRPGGGALRLEEQAVFVPPGSFPGAEAADWLFAGSVVADREEQRRFAGFVVAGERRPGLLTPRNRTVFLYHRLAHDGEVDDLLEAAGAPLVRARFDLHRSGGRLLYVREDCRPADLRWRFHLHLEPEDEGDLPPYRRPYGFDNLDFQFRDRLVEGPVAGAVEGEAGGADEGQNERAARSGRCVAAVRLPDYPLRSLSTGQFRRLPDSPPVEVWGIRFAPGESR